MMFKPRVICLSTCLATLFLLAHCTPDPKPGLTSQGGSSAGGAGSGHGGTSGGMGGSSGATSGGGVTSAGGAPTGGIKGTGGSSSIGGATSSGGSSSTGGVPTGGVKGTGGSGPIGGTTSSGGTTPTGGSTTPTGGGGSGGTTPTGGTTTSTGGTRTDSGGVALAKPGDSTSTSKQYLNLGDMRLLCNRWGSDAMNCGSTQLKVSVNSDKTIGYDFNRGNCDSKHAHPDYPEIEFGVAPFGQGSSDLTSPAFSSTAVLPIQLKSLTSASVNFDNFNSNYAKPGYYDTNFEFWISKQNPLTSSSPGVYAEIIIFLDWDGVRESSTGWPCENLGNVTAGSASYKLCHQKDGWGSGWRFFNFELNGQQKNFSGKADVKAILDFVKSKYSGFTDDMWLTRIEVGTEVDDNTQGSTKISNLTFEVNGTSKSIELAGN